MTIDSYERDTEIAEGGAFVPFEGPTSRGGAPVTKVDACPPFLQTFNPKRWTVMGGRVIPLLGRIPFMSGVNGATAIIDRTTGAEKAVQPSMARGMAEEKGHIIIPFNEIPDSHARMHGQDLANKSYLWKPRGRPDVTLSIYTKCYPGDTTLDCDEKHYLEWIEYLQDRGIIPTPPAYVLRRMLAKMEQERDDLADKARAKPSLAPLLERAEADVRAVQAELEKVEGTRREAPPAPDTGTAFTPDAEPEPTPTPRKPR